MQAAGVQHPGGMAAILGLEVQTVADVCAQAALEAGAIVQVANDNCPGQVVISGDGAALDRALEMLTAAGAKKAVRLAVSIGAHSPLMQPAQDRLDAGTRRGRAVGPSASRSSAMSRPHRWTPPMPSAAIWRLS